MSKYYEQFKLPKELSVSTVFEALYLRDSDDASDSHEDGYRVDEDDTVVEWHDDGKTGVISMVNPVTKDHDVFTAPSKEVDRVVEYFHDDYWDYHPSGFKELHEVAKTHSEFLRKNYDYFITNYLECMK